MRRWKSHAFESEMLASADSKVNKLTKNRHVPSLGLNFEPGWLIPAWCGHHHMKPLQHSHDILSCGSKGGALGPCAPLFWNQTEARRARKNFFLRPPLPPPPSPIIWRSGSATDTMFCLSVTCTMFNRTMFLRFRQVFCLCFLTSCCSSRRNDSSQLVTPAYLMISELAWSRAVKNRAQS